MPCSRTRYLPPRYRYANGPLTGALNAAMDACIVMAVAIALGAISAVVAVAVLVLGLRRCLLMVEVEGPSMTPTLRDGERVLVRRQPARITAGDIVVFRLPGEARQSRGQLIKRVAAVAGDAVPASVQPVVGARPGERVPEHSLVVFGDGPHSTDSRNWGYLPDANVSGVVVRRLAR